MAISECLASFQVHITMGSKSNALAQQALDFLGNSLEPCTALQVSKGIGLSTAKEINPTLYSLEKQGLVEKTHSGSKVCWKCHGGFADASAKKSESYENPVTNYDECQDVEMEPLQEEEGPKKHLYEDFSFRKRSHDSDVNSEDMKAKAVHEDDDEPRIPKAPHQIMRPVGPRTAILAEALYRQPVGEREPTEWVSHERGDHPQSFHDKMNEVPHEVMVDVPGSRPSRFQSLSHSTGIHRPAQMGLDHTEAVDRAMSETDDRMVDKILDFLKQFNRPVSTLEIAKAVHRKTKKEVNPTLYHMERKGLIVKASAQPPAWKLSSSSPPASSFQAPRERQRPPVNRARQSETHYYESIQSGSRPSFFEADQRARQLSWPGEEESPMRPSSSMDVKPPSQRQSLPPQVSSTTQNQTLNDVSSVNFVALNKNPVSAINEYAQRNHMPISFELVHEGKGGPNRFVMAVKLGDRMYNAVSAANMKDARKEAADVALREILSSQETVPLDSQSKIKGMSSLTHFDKIAMLSLRKFMMLSNEVQDKFAGRKVIAAIIMQTYDDEAGVVVSIGAGNRCITGDRLTLDGMTLNDSHAEIICRRAFILYLYSELEKFYANNQSIFEAGGINGKLQIKDGVTWHLYISTAPCGDGALFTPRELNQSFTSSASRDHVPLYDSKQQGLLRTKVEDGEGTIPVNTNDGPQTWDGILRGGRLRTMSCSDKICRWNVLGMQGALLSHIIEPIYLESLTLGYLYEHGHLARAICCRLSKDSDINEKLPLPYSLNHPWLGRVTAYSPSRETQKTNNLSVNWFLGSPGIELTDGRSGACLSRTGFRPTPSRLCKAEIYKQFKGLCSKQQNLQRLSSFETYREAKENSLGFQEAKAIMNKQFGYSKFGHWVKKPRELEMFDV